MPPSQTPPPGPNREVIWHVLWLLAAGLAVADVWVDGPLFHACLYSACAVSGIYTLCDVYRVWAETRDEPPAV